jgi:hypothetical protein
MCRILVTAIVLFGTCDTVATGQEKKPNPLPIHLFRAVDPVATGQEKNGSGIHVTWVTSEQPIEEVELIIMFEDPTYTYKDLLKYAERFRAATSDKEAKKAMGKYIDTLKAMARTEKKRENEKNGVKKLIYALRDQYDFWAFTAKDPKSPAAQLLAFGEKAIPFLIDELENDELTRSVSLAISTKPVIPTRHVLRIGDCVCGILQEITGRSFGDSFYIHDPIAKMSPKAVRDEAKKWWAKQKESLGATKKK